MSKKNYLQKKGEELLKTGKAPLQNRDRDMDYTTGKTPLTSTKAKKVHKFYDKFKKKRK